MYTPPVTPWESEMPEVGDPTVLGKHDRVTAGCKPAVYEKKIRRESQGSDASRREATEVVMFSENGGSRRRQVW